MYYEVKRDEFGVLTKVVVMFALKSRSWGADPAYSWMKTGIRLGNSRDSGSQRIPQLQLQKTDRCSARDVESGENARFDAGNTPTILDGVCAKAGDSDAAVASDPRVLC
jgi:hypothetical protein